MSEVAVIGETIDFDTLPTETIKFATGYYKIIKNHERYQESGFAVDQLAYVYAGQGALYAFINGMQFNYKYDSELPEFKEHFEFAPNGAAIRQQQIANLMAEINTIDSSLGDTTLSLSEFNPYVGVSGEMEGSSSLVPVNTTKAAKFAIATTRNSVMKAKKALVEKTETLAKLAGEQAKALAIKVKEIEALAAKAEEAIWTINLYLGKEEQIFTITEGKPAPQECKIFVRQRAMYMDEECGLDATRGGIDANSINKFDEWLTADPAHLNQIMPEPKGIVALHIRSTGKKYDDPWLSKAMNEANLQWTYLFIRNGDNVYRVHVDMNVGNILFPSASEFEDYFWKYDSDGNKTPLKPGSKEFIKAMDEAEDRQRHYMRILLILQGLMDRTPIFKPMPTDRINLCDPRHCDEWLHLIYETENVITDGNPNFNIWQEELNQQLDVGCRVIGSFTYAMYGERDRNGSRYDGRIFPANAALPNSKILHTIEEREDDKYIIRYQRTGDTIYDWRGHGRDPLTRARCWVTKEDKFILNFDAATVEKLQYYSTHSLSRQYYATMVPLLEIALKLKQQEISEEAPFRQLLVGQIMRRYGVPLEDASAKIDQLVKWWKFKNRTHRALLSDDSKALEMIVDEFGARLKQEAVRKNVESIKDTILRVIGGQTPEPIMIAHKKDNHYVAYVPHNSQQVWVTEQLWSFNRQTGVVNLKEAKRWKTVDKRHERWEIIYKTARWETWVINPMMANILTDHEIDRLIEEALERKTTKLDTTQFLPLAVTCDNDYKLTFWYSDTRLEIPTENIIHTRVTNHSLNSSTIKWKRTIDGVKLEKYQGTSSNWSMPVDDDGEQPWDKSYYKDNGGKIVIRRWSDNINQMIKETKDYEAHRKEVSKLEKLYSYVSGLATEHAYNKLVAKAKLDFFMEHGDPELWEDHLAELKLPHPSFNGLDTALDMLVERHINPTGMALQQVYEEAAKYGLFEMSRVRVSCIPDNLPTDFVVPEARVSDEDVG